MAPQIPGFFKIVFQRNIDSSSLKLPPKFTREYSGELTDVAQLVVSDGRIWKVGLRREGEHISLRNGFDDFARHYSLSHGHLLVYKFKGLSCFSVAIYDNTNCQISYPSHNPRTREEENKVAGAFNSTANQSSGITPKPRTKKVECEYVSKCGIPTPRHFRSKRPHFETRLGRYNFDFNVVYVASDVGKSIGEAQLEKHFIWLETGDERRWKVSLLGRKCGRVNLGRMGEFYKDNQLKENDICIFEVVKENLLKVFIFSAI